MKFSLQTRMKRSEIRFGLLIILLVVGTGLCSRYWYQLLLIQGDSMYPSYHNLQLTILDKRDRDYAYADVVAAKIPGMKVLIVKRIIGCPGDVVEVKDGVLLINGEMSTIYRDTPFAYAGTLKDKVRLNEGEYILIGDNIDQSKDSRYIEIGIVKENQIVGKVWERRENEA